MGREKAEKYQQLCLLRDCDGWKRYLKFSDFFKRF